MSTIPRYNNTPISPEKINLIHELMNDPEVKEAWRVYTMLNQATSVNDRALLKARYTAWHHYVLARDKFLGLPTLNPYFLEKMNYHAK